MHRSLAVVAAVLTSASSSWAQRPTEVQEAKAGIAATWAAFKTHWTAGHARESVAAFFTDDAINMIPGTPSDSGRAAIEKRFAEGLAQIGNRFFQISLLDKRIFPNFVEQFVVFENPSGIFDQHA